MSLDDSRPKEQAKPKPKQVRVRKKKAKPKTKKKPAPKPKVPKPSDPTRKRGRVVAFIATESVIDVLDQIIFTQPMTRSRALGVLIEWGLVQSGALAPSQAPLAEYFENIQAAVRTHRIQTAVS